MILRRLEGSRFSEVVRAWVGETVVMLGGGPSLTAEHFEIVREAHAAGRVKAIAVNDSYLRAPWADVLYAADADWHATHHIGVDKSELDMKADEVRERYASFAGLRGAPEASCLRDERVHILSTKSFPIAPTYSMQPRSDLIAGRNSLHQGLNLAVRAGATRVLLCGCDGGPRNGATHWHGGHQIRNQAGAIVAKPTPEAFWDEMRKSFSAAENQLKELGVQVINCSPGSSIDSFPKMALEEALSD